ncbi:MAG: hypothetical protein JWO60_898, partial [Frankiales bacterium]|nr:hypothetical protein [Frankiales bacterium]
GCPTVLSTGSSLSELVEEPAAYFDGTSVASITEAMTRVLHDDGLCARLRAAAADTTARFTWTRSAELAWDALRGLAGRRPPAPVRAATLGRVETLVQEPLPVALSAPPTSSDSAVLAAEADLGVLSPLPPGALTALAPAPALVVADDALARGLVAAGLVEQTVLPATDDLTEVGAHDAYAALRARLPRPAFPVDLVAALSRPPRWSLQRPWPVWLLLTDEEVDAETLRTAVPDVVLVVARSSAALLAGSVDTVLVDPVLLTTLEGDLHRARCLGTHVVTLDEDRPATLRATSAVRTTGWPWRG